MKFLSLTAAAAAAASLVAAGSLADPLPDLHHRHGMIKRHAHSAHALAIRHAARAHAHTGAANATSSVSDDDDDDDDDSDSESDSDSENNNSSNSDDDSNLGGPWGSSGDGSGGNSDSSWDGSDSDSGTAVANLTTVGNVTADVNHLKNGLAWPNGPYVEIQPYKKSMGWLYSWDATPATGQPDAADFVPENISFYPMLWGGSKQRVANWQKYVLNDRNATRNKAKVAMGPNEVNQQGQALISPSETCELFRQYIMPLKDEDGWKIIGPSTNGGGDGFDWMKEFQAKCPDVWSKIDYSSLHWYGTDPKRAIAYFTKWYETFKQPIYITETACMNYDGTAPPTLQQAYNFVKEVNQWAQDTPFVTGIAFYGAMKSLNINSVNRLATGAGNPSDLFQFWVNNSPTHAKLNTTSTGSLNSTPKALPSSTKAHATSAI